MIREVGRFLRLFLNGFALCLYVCVSLQDEGSVKSKPNVRSAGHPSVMLIHSFSSLSHGHRKAIWTNAHLTLTRGGLLIFVNVVVSASSKQKEKRWEKTCIVQVSPTLVRPKVHYTKNYMHGREQQFLNEKWKKYKFFLEDTKYH